MQELKFHCVSRWHALGWFLLWFFLKNSGGPLCGQTGGAWLSLLFLHLGPVRLTFTHIFWAKSEPDWSPPMLEFERNHTLQGYLNLLPALCVLSGSGLASNLLIKRFYYAKPDRTHFVRLKNKVTL